MSETTNEKKNTKRNLILIFLAFLLIFVCVFGYRVFGTASGFFNPGNEAMEGSSGEKDKNQNDQGQDEGSANQNDQGQNGGNADQNDQGQNEQDSQDENSGSDGQVNPVDFDDDIFYTGVDFADSMGLEVEFLGADAFADGSAVITFGTSGGGGNGGLPPGDYTATVDSGEEALTYECGLNSAEPDNIYCYGPMIGKDTPVVADLGYMAADFTLGGNTKEVLVQASASNLEEEFKELMDSLTDAANSMGIDDEVDNPYEAWGAIGCCIQNVGEDGLSDECKAALVQFGQGFDDGSGNMGGFFDKLEEAIQANPEQAWQNLMDQYNTPPGWTGTGSGGGMSDQTLDALNSRFNACAEALGIENTEELDWFALRMMFDLIWASDPRRGTNTPDGFMGAMYTLFSKLASGLIGLLDIFSGDISALGELWTATIGNLYGTIFQTFCSLGADEDTCSEIARSWGGEVFWEWDDDKEWYQGDFPDACMSFVDYAKGNTYFSATNLGYIGNNYPGSPTEFCAEAMGFGNTPGELQPYMDNDYMYEKIIEAYGHVGNPAMPDPCRAVVQWCDSDQDPDGNPRFYNPDPQGFAVNLTNGCNDPESFAEAGDWTHSANEPDCSGGTVEIPGFDSFEIEIHQNLYCQSIEETIENSPLGDIKACAEGLGYSGLPLESAGDYIDFIAWVGMHDSLGTYVWGPKCQTAVDFAHQLGLVEQSIDTAASTCSQGGPVLLNTVPVEWTMPAVTVPNYGSGGKKGEGGSSVGSSGGSCEPNGTPCDAGSGYGSGVIKNCVCKATN